MNRAEAERVAVEEGKLNADKSGRVTKNKNVATDVPKHVAYAAYMEEMRVAQAAIQTQEFEALRFARQAMEGQITGVPPTEPAGEPAGTAETRTFLASLRATPGYLKPTQTDMVVEGIEFSKKMAAVPGTTKVTANRTVIMMQGAPEQAVVMGWTSAADVNLTAMINTVAAHAGQGSHDVATISREIFAGEENSNARPGLEITFTEPIHISRVQGILDFMRARGIDGGMLQMHEESGLITDYVTGVTIQVIPELNKLPSTAAPDTLLDIADEMIRGNEIKSIEHKLYDTLVLTRTDYGKNGILENSPGAVRSAAWSDRAYYSVNSSTAAERVQKAGEKAPGAPVTLPAQVASREQETAAALVAAGRAAPEVALPIYSKVFEKLLDLQRQHAAVIAGKEWSTAGEPEMTKLKILQAISELDALLKYMPAEIRGKVGGYFALAKAAGSEKALTEEFRKRIQKMADLFEKHMQKEFRAQIDKLFKGARPKKTEGGVVKGHLTPETHAEVARLEAYTKMSGVDLFAKTMAIEAELRSGTLTPEQESERIIAQQDMLAFGAMDEMSAAQLEHAFNVLQGAIKTGRTAWRMSEEVRLEAQRVKAEEIRNLLPEGTGPGIAEANARTISNHVRDYINTHFNFSRLLGRILPEVSFLHDWQEAAYRTEREEKAFVVQINDEIRNRILAAAGISGPLSMAKLGGVLQKMFNTQLPVTHGKTANMFEAIHYVMAWQRVNEQARMEKHGWTQEMIDNLNNALSDPVSQVMIEAFRWGYDQIYQRANEVYKNTFGIELPREKFYVPMTYHGVGGDIEAREPLGGNIFGVSGMTPNAIKGRVSHDHEMRQENAMTVFQSHLMEMSHWIHFTQLGREMRNVLNNAELKMALQQQLGEKGYQGLMKHLQILIQGGPDRASDVKPMVDWIRYTSQNFQKVVLGFNLHVAGIQLDSYFRWATEIPIHRGLKQLAKGTFWTSWKKMANSDAILIRLSKELPEEFQLAMQKSGVTTPMMLQAMQGGWWPLRFTDNGGTMVTGMIVYSDAIDQGMTEEQAFEKAQSAMQRLSQPTGVTTKSGFEVAGSVGVKALTMFTTDPTFKSASYLQAWGDLAKGKDIGMNLQRIAAIHGFGVISQIAGNVIAAALSGGDDEDWDRMLDWKNYLAAMAVAPIQGYFFLGVLATSLIQVATGQKVYTRLAPVQAGAESLAKFARPIAKELHDAIYEPRNFEPAKIYKSLNDAFVAIGTFVPGTAPTMALLRQVKRTWDDHFGEKKKKKRRE